MKRGWIRAAAMLLVSVLLVNVTWYWWRAEKYRPYTAGMQPQVLKTILGHSSLAMTMDLYSHVLPDTKAQEMEKIANIF